ncbi:MAG: baseplate J/gp47 family protein, partial [Mycobacteriales bacterium]
MSNPPALLTNQYGTIGGRDQESDDDSRYRIQLTLSSRTGCSEPDLRAALLKIPGIQDVVFERLAGTYNVYVYGISPDIPASLLSMAQAELDRSTAFPLSGTALAPDLVGITLSRNFCRQALSRSRSPAVPGATRVWRALPPWPIAPGFVVPTTPNSKQHRSFR